MATKQKFIVWVKEVWCQGFEVEAESADAAIDAVDEGMDQHPDQELFEYSHTLDPDTWTCEALEEDYQQPNTDESPIIPT